MSTNDPMDPNSLTFNAYLTWGYFFDGQFPLTNSFFEWRARFRSNDLRCDHCLVFNLYCNPLGGPCTACVARQRQCTNHHHSNTGRPTPHNPIDPRIAGPSGFPAAPAQPANPGNLSLPQDPRLSAPTGSLPSPWGGFSATGNAPSNVSAGQYTFTPAPSVSLPSGPAPRPSNRPGPSIDRRDRVEWPAEYPLPTHNHQGEEITRCAECTKRNVQCDADVSSAPGIGCTSCRRLDVDCRWGTRRIAARPDGLTQPLCCDQCAAGFLRGCSWRQGGPGRLFPCTQCQSAGRPCSLGGYSITEYDSSAMGLTHFNLTMHLPALNSRPTHQREVQGNPRRIFVGGRPRSSSPVQRRSGRRSGAIDGSLTRLCQLCASRVDRDKLTLKEQACNADPSIPRGCTLCSSWGLFCVMDGQALPPMEQPRRLPRVRYDRCDNCTRNNRNCDRKRPCDSCVEANDLPCTGGWVGCFIRGVPGDTLPLYYLKLRYGPSGVHSHFFQDYPRTPTNYHLFYKQPATIGQDAGSGGSAEGSSSGPSTQPGGTLGTTAGPSNSPQQDLGDSHGASPPGGSSPGNPPPGNSSQQGSQQPEDFQPDQRQLQELHQALNLEHPQGLEHPLDLEQLLDLQQLDPGYQILLELDQQQDVEMQDSHRQGSQQLQNPDPGQQQDVEMQSSRRQGSQELQDLLQQLVPGQQLDLGQQQDVEMQSSRRQGSQQLDLGELLDLDQDVEMQSSRRQGSQQLQNPDPGQQQDVEMQSSRRQGSQQLQDLLQQLDPAYQFIDLEQDIQMQNSRRQGSQQLQNPDPGQQQDVEMQSSRRQGSQQLQDLLQQLDPAYQFIDLEQDVQMQSSRRQGSQQLQDLEQDVEMQSSRTQNSQHSGATPGPSETATTQGPPQVGDNSLSLYGISPPLDPQDLIPLGHVMVGSPGQLLPPADSPGGLPPVSLPDGVIDPRNNALQFPFASPQPHSPPETGEQSDRGSSGAFPLSTQQIRIGELIERNSPPHSSPAHRRASDVLGSPNIFTPEFIALATARAMYPNREAFAPFQSDERIATTQAQARIILQEHLQPDEITFHNQLTTEQVRYIGIANSPEEAASFHGVIEEYARVWQGAQHLFQELGQVLDLRTLRRHLRVDMLTRITPDESVIINGVRQFLEQRFAATNQPVHAEVPVNTADSDQQAVALIHPSNEPMRNVTQEPIIRPRSPGPPHPVFRVNNEPVEDFLRGYMQFAEGGNPEFDVNVGRIRRPLPPRPNPTSAPVLGSIPTERLTNQARVVPEPTLRCMEMRGNQQCGQPTASACEDTTHSTHFAICDDCENECRARFFQWASNMAYLRAFLCSDCSNDMNDNPQFFAYSGVRVFGFPVTANELVHPHVPTEGSGWNNVGGFMGDALAYTGCSCGPKLIDRRICSAHRMHYLVALRNRLQEYEAWVGAAFATRNVCPMCSKRPSMEVFNFRGEKGCEGRRQSWLCKACHGVVFVPPDTGMSPLLGFNADPRAGQPEQGTTNWMDLVNWDSSSEPGSQSGMGE